MSHPYFLSYARNDDPVDSPDPVVEEFVQQLDRRVRYFAGAHRDGFRDRSAILTGELWKNRLFQCLQESETLVCLYSPSFFASEFCGKELQVFLHRRQKFIRENVGQKPANIIPVLWHSVQGSIPRTLPDFQYKAANLDPSRYGVWTLGDRMKRDRSKESEFYDIIDDIAIRIRDAIRSTPLPKSTDDPHIDSVLSAFDHPPLPLPEFDAYDSTAGPDSITFAYPSPPSWHLWPHSPPEEQAVLCISSMIAKGKEFEPHQLSFDPRQTDLISRLDAARERNNVVMMFVDGASLADPQLQALMVEYDQQLYETFSTVVIWNGNKTHQLENNVRETFRFFSSRRPPFFHSAVTGPEEFDHAISSSLEALRSEVLRKPRTTNLIQKHSEFSIRPVVSGPGGVPVG
jgi:hypothetical protein